LRQNKVVLHTFNWQREKKTKERKNQREKFFTFFFIKNKEAPKFFNKYFIVNNLKASLFANLHAND